MEIQERIRVLREARQTVTDAWTRKYPARTVPLKKRQKIKGAWELTHPKSPEAVKWCLVGAIVRACQGPPEVFVVIEDIKRAINWPETISLSYFNDMHRNNRPIIDAIDRTITFLERQITVETS